MLKRITKIIPKTEYRKLYDALFKSHLSYCISSWGGVSESKLSNVFRPKKGVYDFYIHLIMQVITKLVHEPVLIKIKYHPRITA